MKRIYGFFTRVDLCFWLLLLASGALFAGVVVATVFEAETRELNSTLLPVWFGSHLSRPVLYVWILVLAILLCLLALNTVVCTVKYVRCMVGGSASAGKIGIVLFHLAFLVALCGHFLSEFGGMSESVVLEKDKVSIVEGTDLRLETLDVSHSMIGSKDRKTGVELAIDYGEGPELVDVRVMHPVSVEGYDIHFSFKDKGLERDQVMLTVKRDPGRHVILVAGVLAVIAVVFFCARGRQAQRLT